MGELFLNANELPADPDAPLCSVTEIRNIVKFNSCVNADMALRS